MEYTYDYFKKSADYIRSVIGGFEPEIGLILGTGLGKFSARIEDQMGTRYRKVCQECFAKYTCTEAE